MNYKKIFFLGILLWLVTALFMWLSCGWLFEWIYKVSPTKLWESHKVIMKLPNVIGRNFFCLLHSWIFVFVYALLYKGVPVNGYKKGIVFGSLVWLLSSFTGFAMLGFIMKIAKGVIIYWILQSLILNWIKGFIVGIWYHPKIKIEEDIVE